MEPAAESGSSSGHDWSRLPEDLLLSVLRALHVADAVGSGAVCTTWHAAYGAFRRLRVPSPRQPPCLLYASDGLAPGAAALHCPATGATLRIPFPLAPLARRPLLGSGHGWLVTADEAADLHLVNPVTGAQVALPPITALHHVEAGGTDEQGNPAYNVYHDLPSNVVDLGPWEIDTRPTILGIHRAHELYYRVVLSASPAAGRACVVLLLHMPNATVSFARLGDERWTWEAPGDGVTGLPWGYGNVDAMYSAAAGVFYLLQVDASMYSLDLNGPQPVARKVLDAVPRLIRASKYLVQTPSGDVLQVWRWRKHDVKSSELNTTDVQLYKVDLDGQRLEMIKSLPECALFLGVNASMCLPVKEFRGLKPDCAYVTDEIREYVNMEKYNRREIGIWSMADKSMSRLVDVSPVIHPWLKWPFPIWIKPCFL